MNQSIDTIDSPYINPEV